VTSRRQKEPKVILIVLPDDCWHRTDGSGPCEACWMIRCKSCGQNSLIGKQEKCSVCKSPFKITPEEHAYMTHPRGMSVCPKCHRKMRKKPRDKRRSIGLKKTDELPPVLEFVLPHAPLVPILERIPRPAIQFRPSKDKLLEKGLRSELPAIPYRIQES
jgi:hypothetical protein